MGGSREMVGESNARTVTVSLVELFSSAREDARACLLHVIITWPPQRAVVGRHYDTCFTYTYEYLYR